MKRFREWLYRRFLPMVAKETLWKERDALAGRVKELEGENRRLQAYIDGMEAAMRAGRRVVIRNEVSR